MNLIPNIQSIKSRFTITRNGAFLIIYSSLLFIPYALALFWQQTLITFFNESWWLAPLIVSTVLATVGPFIYLYIQKKAEDRLNAEQRQYQGILRNASLGMGDIKDLNKLLRLIVYIVARTVKTENCKIFLYHKDSQKYVLKATRRKEANVLENSFLKSDSAIFKLLSLRNEPILFDDIRQRAMKTRNPAFIGVVDTMIRFNIDLIVPSYIEDQLIAIIGIGKKKNGKIYTQDDLAVFSILANQSALAIENAQFYEEMQRTHEQLFKADKMATIGTMADGLSHQINNRLHAMGFIAGDLLDSIKIYKRNSAVNPAVEVLTQVEHALGRIEENVKHGGEIVEGLLKYTRKGEEGFSSILLSKLLSSSFEMAQFKVNIQRMSVVMDNVDGFQIKGNSTQLQEVFFNIIDNAYYSMMQRKSELNEKDYQPTLTISVEPKGKSLDIIVRDNGLGVKKEDLNKMFTPFFTTKLKAKKGTGLGMYVIKQIVEENHGGRVDFTSEYLQGAVTVIRLPLAV